jgi:hypothetical protein
LSSRIAATPAKKTIAVVATANEVKASKLDILAQV